MKTPPSTPLLYGPRGNVLSQKLDTPEQRNRAIRAIEAAARNAWNASETNRFNADWVTTNEDINVALQRELATIRSRSNWLARNNPYASGAINTLLNYCVGTGFDLQMTVASPKKTAKGFQLIERDAFNDYTEDLFRYWGDDVSIHASSSSPMSFEDCQSFAFRRLVTDGEVFCHLVYDKGRDVVPLTLEFISPNSLDTITSEHNGNPVVMGVELDKRSWQPVAYWVYSKAGADPRYSRSYTNSVRIPASDMIHAFVMLEPYQVRGLPFVSAVANTFRDIAKYTDAQLIRNRIAALFGVFIKGADGGGSFVQDTTASDTTQSGTGFPVDSNGNILANLAPGIVGKLPEGYEIDTVNPTSPENSFTPFLEAHLKAIATGYQGGLSYTSLTRDTSHTTFASGRQAENMDHQGFRPLMRFFSRRVLSPILRRWMDAGVLSGAITAPGYEVNPKYWQRHAWMPAGWPQGINPLQDVKAAVERMKAGITTLADECAYLGLDWKTQVRKAAKIAEFEEFVGKEDDEVEEEGEDEERSSRRAPASLFEEVCLS